MKNKQLLIVLLIASVSTVKIVNGAQIKPIMRGLAKLDTPGNVSRVAQNCSNSFTPQCDVIDKMIIRAEKHAHLIRQIENNTKILAVIEDSLARKIALERIEKLKKEYPNYEIANFLDTLCSEDQEKLDAAIIGVLQGVRTSELDYEVTNIRKNLQ